MPRSTKMSAPVTHEELRTELATLDAKFDARFEAINARLDTIVTRPELEARFAAMEARLDACATRTDLELWGGALNHSIASLEQRMTAAFAKASTGIEQRLSAELARHVRASDESMRVAVGIVDDKYADLPGRVTALEQTARR